VLERLFVIAPKAEDVSAPERTARTDFIPLRLS
jgi:hypothetical protein